MVCIESFVSIILVLDETKSCFWPELLKTFGLRALVWSGEIRMHFFWLHQSTYTYFSNFWSKHCGMQKKKSVCIHAIIHWPFNVYGNKCNFYLYSKGIFHLAEFAFLVLSFKDSWTENAEWLHKQNSYE